GAYLAGAGQDEHATPWTADAAAAGALTVELSDDAGTGSPFGAGGVVVHVSDSAGTTICRHRIPRMTGCYVHFAGHESVWEIDDVVLSNVSSVSPYDDWIQSFFPGETDPEIVGKHADPDRDGVSNLLEFAFHGDPTDGGSRRLAQVVPGSSGHELVM